MTSIPEISARGSLILWAKFQIPVDPRPCVGPRSGRKGDKWRPLDHERHGYPFHQPALFTHHNARISFYIYAKLFQLSLPCGIYIMSCNIVHLLFTHALFQIHFQGSASFWSNFGTRYSEEGALGFSVLRFVPFFRSVFRFLYEKTSIFRFWRLLRFSRLFCSGFLVFGKNEIGLLDLLFDAVWWFSGLSSENLRLNDVNHMHVFSGFARGFRFWLKFISVLRLFVFFVRFCRFWYTPVPPRTRHAYCRDQENVTPCLVIYVKVML